jgi:SAM-dependent methyltransferase
VGLDLSADLLRLAAERGRKAGADFALLRGDMRVLPFLSTSLTSVLSLFTAFGYFGGLIDNAPVVAEVARILRPGGHWFLDYFNAELVASELAAELATAELATPELATAASGAGDSGPRQRELGPLLVTEQRRLLSDPARVGKKVQLRPLPDQLAAAAAWGVPPEGLEYMEEVALFTLAELDDLLAEHGLARVAAAGDYDGQPLDGERSPRWLLVYRKTTAGDSGGKS